jgi:hypothetical protein
MRRKKKVIKRDALIQAYGLFWRCDEINWNPGMGKSNEWRLLGRRGAISGKLKIADFRTQRGIYILYGNYGAHYVGITRKKGLGPRLKDHRSDRHKNMWDRFSWFGFRKVLTSRDEWGLQKFGKMPLSKSTSPDQMIGDIEALLIRSLALKNINNMKLCLSKRVASNKEVRDRQIQEQTYSNNVDQASEAALRREDHALKDAALNVARNGPNTLQHDKRRQSYPICNRPLLNPAIPRALPMNKAARLNWRIGHEADCSGWGFAARRCNDRAGGHDTLDRRPPGAGRCPGLGRWTNLRPAIRCGAVWPSVGGL